MIPCSRRQFLQHAPVLGMLTSALVHAAPNLSVVEVEERICGLMWGTALGDALGGPIEFQPRNRIQNLLDPPKVWQPGEKLNPSARAATAARLRLRSYRDLRPTPESYGQWNQLSEPGTITDDTRHKLVLLFALERADRTGRWPLTVQDLAKAYLDWPSSPAIAGRPGYEALARDWLEEWQLAARWVLGERDLSRALPPERMWQSLPTCSGQMTLLPIAALEAGRPEAAYRAAYDLAFFDNGFGKDLNAALVAGLAEALVTPWDAARPRMAYTHVFEVMRTTDPFRFRQIRWTERAVDRWLNLALKLAREAEGEPARLFARLDQVFAETTKWEAQVPVVVAVSCLELADYDALAAVQLCLEWGHDSDSYAQLIGAMAGALQGPNLFPESWRTAVGARLQADHGVDWSEACRFLCRTRTGIRPAP
ncbi:MAG: ADP-ribosylglycohydrolase family protein [Verrucomicrobia bacterium]|nr:ADP-ribosylglycohydrolase family protein [Verrucomicrobiota bacterium]